MCVCIYVCVCVCECQNYQRKYCGKVQISTARDMLCSVKCEREVRSERREKKRLGDARNRACDALYCTALYCTLFHIPHIPPRCHTLLCHAQYICISICQSASVFACLVQRIYPILRYDILYYVCAVLYCVTSFRRSINLSRRVACSDFY